MPGGHICLAAAFSLLVSQSNWHVIRQLKLPPRLASVMQIMSSLRTCLSVALPVYFSAHLSLQQLTASSARLAFSFLRSSFCSCPPLLVPSLLCSCKMEYQCIINVSAVLSLLVHASTSYSDAAEHSGFMSGFISLQQQSRRRAVQLDRLSTCSCNKKRLELVSDVKVLTDVWIRDEVGE